MAELVTFQAKHRGPGAKDKAPVEYKGVGRVVKDEKGNEEVVTEGVLTDIEDGLALPGIEGNIQRLLDFAVIGYNKFQRDAALDVDEFAPYLVGMPEEKHDAFKRAVRAIAKAADIEVADAATMVLSRMKKAEVSEEVSA
jgi:hypothetical protein